MIKWSFENNAILKNMTGVQREKIVMNSKQNNYKKGAVFFQQGQAINKLIFILEGGIEYVYIFFYIY